MATRIQEIKKKIALLSAELHNEFHPDYGNWYPKFPWVLVYVLPREQRIGSLWVPGDEKHQNKVTLEGVVVKLWKADHLKIKTALEVGDHVLFQHYAGQPFSFSSEQEFRMVKEGFTNFFGEDGIMDSGHIFSKLNYSEKAIQGEFWNLLHKTVLLPKKVNPFEAFKVLSKNFVIYPKESKTLSGV